MWTSTRCWIFTVVSRVMEKTAAYPMAVLWDIFKRRGDAASFQEAHLIADGCSNLKNATLIGTMGYLMLGAFGWWKNHTNNGCPKHLKTELDGDFGTNRKIKHLASLRTCLMADVLATPPMHAELAGQCLV